MTHLRVIKRRNRGNSSATPISPPSAVPMRAVSASPRQPRVTQPDRSVCASAGVCSGSVTSSWTTLRGRSQVRDHNVSRCQEAIGGPCVGSDIATRTHLRWMRAGTV